ncbi:MAG TPA: hypothetical protein VG324_21170 [Blastocatellia bacterium]|nr:hypothetical protein [Blastocatellia bacterium]
MKAKRMKRMRENRERYTARLLYSEVVESGKSMSQEFCALGILWEGSMMWWQVNMILPKIQTDD